MDLPFSPSLSDSNLPAGSKPPTFAHKLYRILEENNYPQLISWHPSGSSFTVINSADFAQTILPLHFKHQNFSSFVRQLNMYGFHKINKTPRSPRPQATSGNYDNVVWEFSHPKFQRGRPELLHEIRRRAGIDTARAEGKSSSDSLSALNQQNNTLIRQLQKTVAFQQFIIENMTKVLSRNFPELNMKNMVEQYALRNSVVSGATGPGIMVTHPDGGLSPGFELMSGAVSPSYASSFHSSCTGSDDELQDSYQRLVTPALEQQMAHVMIQSSNSPGASRSRSSTVAAPQLNIQVPQQTQDLQMNLLLNQQQLNALLVAQQGPLSAPLPSSNQGHEHQDDAWIHEWMNTNPDIANNMDLLNQEK